MDLGRTLIAIGLVLVVVGLFLVFKNDIPGMRNLGQLPGDISFGDDRFRFYFPLMTSLILSLVLSLIVYLIRKF